MRETFVCTIFIVLHRPSPEIEQKKLFSKLSEATNCSWLIFSYVSSSHFLAQTLFNSTIHLGFLVQQESCDGHNVFPDYGSVHHYLVARCYIYIKILFARTSSYFFAGTPKLNLLRVQLLHCPNRTFSDLNEKVKISASACLPHEDVNL